MGTTTGKPLKIGIYDPYLDILGGGERYVLTIAEYYSLSHEVDLLWPESSIKETIRQRLNINSDRINFVNINNNISRKKALQAVMMSSSLLLMEASTYHLPRKLS